MGVHNILSKAEFDGAIKSSKLSVVDFFATWCGPCKTIAPKIVAFSDEFPDVTFYKVDVDDHPEISAEANVTAMPTFVFYKDGKAVGTVVGANSPGIEALIKQYC